jgi:hypothetical protein
MSSFSSFRINSKFIILIQALLSFSFAIIVLYPNLSAKWSFMDDHEIINYMGKDHQLSFKEIPGMLMKTEAGFNTSLARYRPVYFLLKLIETAMWGNNPFLWYAFRIAMFGASIFISWLLLGRFLGIIAGGLVCLLFLSHPFWGGPFLMALGPAEHYCLIGLALYCFAFVKLWGQETSYANNFWWVILAFGAIVCMGSKENFLILLPFTGILVYHVWQCDKLNKISIFINSLYFIFGLFIVIAVIVVLKKNHGVDIYSKSVDLNTRFEILLSGFFSLSHWKIQIPFWLSVCFVLCAILFHKYKGNKISEVVLIQMKRLFIAETACVLIWYSQFVFYNGQWPVGGRYDFPGVLAQDLAYIFLIFSPLAILKNLSSDFDLQRVIKVVRAVLIISLSLFIMRYGISNYKKLYDESIAHRNETRQIALVIAQITNAAKSNPGAPIIIVANSVLNIEPVVAIRIFLAANGINNPLVLYLNGLSESRCSSNYELDLFRELRNISEGKEDVGNSVFPSPRFYAANSLPQPIKPCFVLTF